MLGTAFRPSAEISFYSVKRLSDEALQPASAEEKPPGRCGAAPVWLGIANGGTSAADKRRRAYDCGALSRKRSSGHLRGNPCDAMHLLNW